MDGLVGWAAAAPLTYLVIAAVIAAAGVFPPLPSDGLLVASMALAVSGELSLLPLAVATTGGSVLGDLAAYGLGRSVSGRARARAGRSARGSRALAWLEEREGTWLPVLVVVARFVPGGTTSVGVSAGILRLPATTFLACAAVGSLLWTAYGAGVGLVGRSVFPDTLLAAVALSLVTGLLVGAVLHLATRRHRTG